MSAAGDSYDLIETLAQGIADHAVQDCQDKPYEQWSEYWGYVYEKARDRLIEAYRSARYLEGMAPFDTFRLGAVTLAVADEYRKVAA